MNTNALDCKYNFLQFDDSSLLVGREIPFGEFNWLPVIEKRDLALLKVTFKALYDAA